mmetsp:Transcript_119554/g.187532  ORF Transcript_119554/g.187532 Transcript_119554/m.187532 type:complete len:399 (-) Transcript_119554:15-1211(-)
MASFPIITDIIFTWLARRNHEKYTSRKVYEKKTPCSAYSVQERMNAGKLGKLAHHYVSEVKQKLALLRRHIEMLDSHLQNIEEEAPEGISLSDFKAAREIFKKMQTSSCRRYPFEGSVGKYLYDEDEIDHPIRQELLDQIPANSSVRPAPQKPADMKSEDWMKQEIAWLMPILQKKKRGDLVLYCHRLSINPKHKYLGKMGKKKSDADLRKGIAEAIARKAAISGEYPLGTCLVKKVLGYKKSSDHKCGLKHSVCADDPNNPVDGVNRCMCEPGYCFKIRECTTMEIVGRQCFKPKGSEVWLKYQCKKPNGKLYKKSFNALLAWVRRAELRIGLILRRLKDFSIDQTSGKPRAKAVTNVDSPVAQAKNVVSSGQKAKRPRGQKTSKTQGRSEVQEVTA